MLWEHNSLLSPRSPCCSAGSGGTTCQVLLVEGCRAGAVCAGAAAAGRAVCVPSPGLLLGEPGSRVCMLGCCMPLSALTVSRSVLEQQCCEASCAQPTEGKGMLPIVDGRFWIKSLENNNIMVYLALTMVAVLSDCRQ